MKVQIEATLAEAIEKVLGNGLDCENASGVEAVLRRVADEAREDAVFDLEVGERVDALLRNEDATVENIRDLLVDVVNGKCYLPDARGIREAFEARGIVPARDAE